MTYVLQGLLGSLSRMRSHSVHDASILELKQEIGLLLFTKPFRMARAIPSFPLTYGLADALPESIAALCREHSHDGSSAYVEFILFGDINPEACVLWRNGTQVEQVIEEHKHNAVNQALRFLGVQRGTSPNEWSAVGIGEHVWKLEGSFNDNDGA